MIHRERPHESPHATNRRALRLARCWAAAAALVAPGAHAATYCVHSSFELTSALSDAGNGGIANGHDNTILLASGTFVTSGGPFTFNSASGFALTVEGGYDAACSQQSLAPGSSALDGNGASVVLNAQTNGTFTLRHVTIQNGFDGGSAGAGARISLTAAAANAVLDSNVFRNNVSTYAAGGLTVFGSGDAHLTNNLFVGNSAPSGGAFSTGLSAGSSAYITNNTITGNTSTNPTSFNIALGGGDPATAFYVTNTISYGNVATYDFYLYGFETALFANNDYSSISGATKPGSGGNLTGVDPLFVGPGDYRLKPASPLLRAGMAAPPGDLPATDIEGNPRVIAGGVDIGAYENVDVIFASGFDH